MTTPYDFIPLYGVEPSKSVPGSYTSDAEGLVPAPEATAAYGGGSEVTGDNLLIGLWSITDIGASAPIQGARIRLGGELESDGFGVPPGITDYLKMFEPAFASRTSLKFLLNTAGDLEWPVFGVLNPPGALKDKMRGAVKDPKIDPAVVPWGVSWTALKSILDSASWSVRNIEQAGGLSAQVPSGGDFFLAGNGYPIDLTGGALPLLRTNGADGEYPTFYDNTTPAGVMEQFAAMESGDFYIPMLFDGNDGFFQEVAWPHSGARGGV
jgi:hypothetical protein